METSSMGIPWQPVRCGDSGAPSDPDESEPAFRQGLPVTHMHIQV